MTVRHETKYPRCLLTGGFNRECGRKAAPFTKMYQLTTTNWNAMKTHKTLAALILSTLMLSGLAHAQASDAQVLSTLQIQSSATSLHPMCNADFLAKQEQQLNGTIARADFITASAQGEIMSANVSTCALQSKNSLPQWADQAGRLLALSVIATTRIPGGMSTPKTVASGDRASLLLEYAAAHGAPTAAEFLRVLQQSSYRTFN